jgi:serine/threonine protein kinase
VDNYVGPYRILRLINRGGQGTVYLGYDKRLHRKVAIKIYGLPSLRAERRQLLGEARIVASIHSPKIVQIHDVIESRTHLALVMEYVPGCSLEEFLAVVRPSLASVLTVAADVAGALALARQRHIVHGDVKAGNVLITRSGRAKLTDFGIARTTVDSTALRSQPASFSALSPEHLLGKPLDERADFFALGTLLYRMLSGRQPFMADGIPDPEMLLNQPHRPLPDIVGPEVDLPPAMVSVVDRLLQKDPLQRPANTRSVRQVFRSVLHSLPMSARQSLAREAQRCFRPESPEDLPLQLPRSLGQEGRSALLPSDTRAARLWHWMKAFRWPARTAAALALMAAVSAPVVMTLRNTVSPVRFMPVQSSVENAATLPPGISSRWLLDQVKQAMQTRLGRLRIVGPVGAEPKRIFYSRGEPSNWNEHSPQIVGIDLRCSARFCILAMSREEDGQRFHQQQVLFPDMSRQQWLDIVRGTTLALYP